MSKKCSNNLFCVFKGDSYEKNEYYDILLIVVNTEVIHGLLFNFKELMWLFLWFICYKKKKEAEVICQLMKKCFELLYIERTMSLLDQVIGSDDGSNSNCSTSISVGESFVERKLVY